MKPARQARVVCIALGVCLAAYAAPSTPFERAQRQRAVLEARPEAERTQLAYKRVLDAYRAIARDALRLLAPGGRVMVELGAGQGPAVTTLFTGAGLKVTGLRDDLAGIPRALIAAAAS